MADLVGPSSATDNAIVRFDGTTGKLVQNSTGILTDGGALSGISQINCDTGTITNSAVANNCSFVSCGEGTSSIGSNCETSSAISSTSITMSSTTASVFKRNVALATESVSMAYTGSGVMANNACVASKNNTFSTAGSGVMQCNLQTGGYGTGNSISKAGTGEVTNNIVMGKNNTLGGGTDTNVTGVFIQGEGNSIGTASSDVIENCVIMGLNNAITSGKRLTVIGSENAVSGDQTDAVIVGSECTVNVVGCVLLADKHSSASTLTGGTNVCSARFAGLIHFYTGVDLNYGAYVAGTEWAIIEPELTASQRAQTVAYDDIYKKYKHLTLHSSVHAEDKSRSIVLDNERFHELFGQGQYFDNGKCNVESYQGNASIKNAINTLHVDYVTVATVKVAQEKIAELENESEEQNRELTSLQAELVTLRKQMEMVVSVC
jgi:hypothetical protein